MRIPGISHDARRLLLSLVIVILSTSVLLPGKSGPFIFDDYTNLIDNSYVKITSLDFESLRQAAYSLDAGPLKRPVAMVSFAINHYFAGNFSDSTPYKLTNIFIHAINGMLVLWMMLLVFGRLAQSKTAKARSAQTPLYLATAVAILWTVHPIQVSGVLYVIQRMTELSALFTLLALVCYLKGRIAVVHGHRWGAWLLITGPSFFGALAILSKENALLLPIYILLLEAILYGKYWPWTIWKRLDQRTRWIISLALVGIAIAVLIGAVLYAMPSYSVRRFTMTERLLTETRVLFFYLSLIFVPRINQFGHQHDDIVLSTSLLSPWTTFPAVLGHISVLVLAITLLARKRYPLLALGILWFYVSHLLESTIFGLEIAYEHRNYLALLGPIMILMGGIEIVRTRLGWGRAHWFIPVLVTIFALNTFLRASQWADTNAFYRYEALHHPNSARIQVGLSILLEAQKQYPEAMQAIRRAIEIEPEEAGHWLQLHLLAAHAGTSLPPEDHRKPIELMKSGPLSASVFLALQHTSKCIQTWCQSLQIPLETWAWTILDRGENAPQDKSFYYYLIGLSCGAQGRVQDAIKYLRLSHESDPAYLHPLFALASIHVQRKELDEAEKVLAELQRANARSRHPRTPEIEIFQNDVEAMRVAQGRATPVPAR